MTLKSTPPPLRRASREPDTIAPDGCEIRLLATLAEGATRAGPNEARPADSGGLGEPTV